METVHGLGKYIAHKQWSILPKGFGAKVSFNKS